MNLQKLLMHPIPMGRKVGLANSFSIGILFANSIVFANNISVTNSTLTGKNTTLDYVLVQFDIAWENSWRSSGGPSNWDAAWVFVKYRITTQSTWNHATLNWVDGTGSGDGHTEPANTNIASSNDGAGGAYGVFIYRTATLVPPSNVSYTGVQLRWNYGVDGVADGDDVEICVFAVEMVYVPQASFYVGDGTTTDIRGQFENGTTGSPLQITSEGALTLGGGGAGSLGNNNAAGMTTADDFNDVTSQALPAAFPKGYNAFYCMKYEITQQQYVDFLNKLTYSQQATLTIAAPNSAAGTGALINPNADRNGIDIMTPGVATSTPAVYACNFNGNGVYNESDDGQTVSCNWLEWRYLIGYLDWTALRPMTELEYEKATRGKLFAVANEYAWGNTSITNTTGISYAGTTNEVASNSDANSTYNGVIGGPLRVGNFGRGVTVNVRVRTGASYYGIMDLSSNNWERPVTVGNATGRAFTGNNGNGVLPANGNADVTNWPASADAIGSGLRGGAWNGTAITIRVSDRTLAATTYNFQNYNFGGRGVRAAP